MKKDLDRYEQEALFYKIFPEFDKLNEVDGLETWEKWQDFQLLIYNIIRRWKQVE